VPDLKPFGRRAVPPHPPSTTLAPVDPFEPMALSPEAEAFRAQLAGQPRRQDFSDWRRAQRARWLVTWGLTLVFLAPGAICFALDLPKPLAIGLEIAGFGVNAWLRRARRQRLRDIATWEEAQDGRS
jgi:hypothetical protein